MTITKPGEELFRRARNSQPHDPLFVEMIDALEAAGPFKVPPFQDVSKRPRLNAAVSALLDGDHLVEVPGRVFTACTVGIITLSKEATLGRSTALRDWFGALARCDPLFLYETLHYPWSDCWDFDINDAPAELATEDVHRLVDAAGAKYCLGLAQSYWRQGDSVRCAFPSLRNAQLRVAVTAQRQERNLPAPA